MPYKDKVLEKEHNKIYRQKNKDRLRQQEKLYRLTHSKVVAARKTVYEKQRRITNPNYKLAYTLRVRLCNAVKGNQKAGSAVRDLGCSVSSLREYLEKQFQEGMSWDNHGEWHIDHIKPLSSFDLTNREQFLEANHYSNLQPLWAKDNFAKGDKV